MFRTFVAFVCMCSAVSASAKIGETYAQVQQDAQRDRDVASIGSYNFKGNLVLGVRYRNQSFGTHIFNERNREISFTLSSHIRLTRTDIQKIQRPFHTTWHGRGRYSGIYLWESDNGLSMGTWYQDGHDYLVIQNYPAFKALVANQKRSAPSAPLPVAPADSSARNDCLIVATETYARLKKTAYWARIAGFAYSKGEPGHAVVLFQPTKSSTVWLYDATGSRDLQTQSHDLSELAKAITGCLKVGEQVSDITWIGEGNTP